MNPITVLHIYIYILTHNYIHTSQQVTLSLQVGGQVAIAIKLKRGERGGLSA
jgi:hypothetical protein